MKIRFKRYYRGKMQSLAIELNGRKKEASMFMEYEALYTPDSDFIQSRTSVTRPYTPESKIIRKPH